MKLEMSNLKDKEVVKSEASSQQKMQPFLKSQKSWKKE